MPSSIPSGSDLEDPVPSRASSHHLSSDPGSESDDLDSLSPRKRRKLFDAPSRIGRKIALNSPARLSEPILSAPSVPVDHNSSFDSLKLKPWLVRSLANMAIKSPTRIQAATIPAILEGRNVIGTSRTGSGKTVAFAAPILQQVAQDPSSIFAVILTATRELALQIHQQVQAIGAPRSVKTILITGGSDMTSQAIALAKRPHIVVATPGRLADHIRQSGEDTVVGLKRVKFLILDEADRLLAPGPGSMLPDLGEILELLPPSQQRQTLCFTATMTPELLEMKNLPAKPGKKPAHVVEVDTQKLAVPTTLLQTYIQVQDTHKEYYLHAFLLTEGNVDRSVMIFCNKTSTAEYLHHLLRLLEHRVTGLYSKLPQRERNNNLERFRASAARILVATDVASRGLDIPEVSLVVHYDLPQDPDDYIHRSGRTARAGRRGTSVSLVGQRGVDRVHAIEKRVGGEQMQEWKEEGVNLETRFVRDYMKLVTEKKREALLNIEEHRDVVGKRKRGKQRAA
ncbi:DEAD-domain-containing protein [Xylariaceae sp. FL0016]|nr:DEAD-domain-containing protein [Xylariaceae sp. FL0016]